MELRKRQPLNIDERYESKKIHTFRNLLSRKECNEAIAKYEKDIDKHQCVQVNGATINRHIPFVKPIYDKIKPRLEKESNTKYFYDGGGIRKYFEKTHLVDHYDYVYSGMYLSIVLGQQPDDDKIEDIHVYVDDVKYIYKLNIGDGLIFPGSQLYHGRPPVFHTTFHMMILIMSTEEKNII